LVKEFAPVFDVNDLLNLQKAHIYIKLLVDGIAAPAFSSQTLPPKDIPNSYRDQVVEHSRAVYGRPRDEVEAMIDETAGYRQKREAEQAHKTAQDSLNKASSLAIHPPKPAATPIAVPVATPAPQPVLAPAPTPVLINPIVQLPVVADEVGKGIVTAPEQVSESVVPYNEEGEESRVERQEKPLKIMEGLVWKEVAQKGGSKWYLGEPEEAVRARQAEKLRLKELATESPTLVSPTEQTSNEDIPVTSGVMSRSEVVEPAVWQSGPLSTVSTLREGESINLPL